VAATYQDKMLNLSLYGPLVQHTVGYSFVRPLLAAPTGLRVALADVIVLLVALGLAAAHGLRAEGDAFDLAWCVLVLAILLVSPVTWLMSGGLLLLPIAVFARGSPERRPFAGTLGAGHVLVALCVVVRPEALPWTAARLAAVGGWAPPAPLPGARKKYPSSTSTIHVTMPALPQHPGLTPSPVLLARGSPVDSLAHTGVGSPQFCILSHDRVRRPRRILGAVTR